MPTDYYNSKKTVEDYIKLAKDVDGGEIIEKLKKYLPKHAKVLELGSGPGSDWKILNSYFKTTGSDNSKVFLNHLSNAHPDGDFLLVDAIEIKLNQNFEGIYSNKVLHHLKLDELKLSIKAQFNILGNEGIICHSFWKGEGKDTYNGLFVQYHNVDSLKELFEEDFDILQLEKYKEFDEGDSILLIAKKRAHD